MVTVFTTKYVTAGATGEIMPVAGALEKSWYSDAHYAQYDAGARLTKGCARAVKFSVVALDLDAHNGGHDPGFLDLLHCLPFVPNFAHQTRQGVRLIYSIEPLTNPMVFEAHAVGFRTRIAESVHLLSTCLKVDETASDWTRLFRSARVVRDGRRTWDTPVLKLHENLLSLVQFEAASAKVSKIHKVSGQLTRWAGLARKIAATIHAIDGYGGHPKTFYVARLFAKHLDRANAESAFAQWNQTNAHPRWSDRELKHKLDDAYGGSE